jgi:hypothetical protein
MLTAESWLMISDLAPEKEHEAKKQAPNKPTQ